MKSKALLPLALVLVAIAFTGCAHQKTRTGSKTNLLFGLAEIERGAYQPAGINTFDFNLNDTIGNPGKYSGTQAKFAWGMFTVNDY